MTYTVKYTDPHGAGWFLRHRGMWSDSFQDACHFETKEEAEAEAQAATDRLNARPDIWYDARVRVVPMKSESLDKFFAEISDLDDYLYSHSVGEIAQDAQCAPAQVSAWLKARASC